MKTTMVGAELVALLTTTPAMPSPVWVCCPTMARGQQQISICVCIRAFNEKALSRAAMKIPPCRCIPASERMDRVYKNPPPGMTCGCNGHQGLLCGRL